MKVIVLRTTPTVGEAGQVVNVKDGYARNYLIPQGIAQPATGQNIKHLEGLKAARSKRKDHLLKTAEELGRKISGLSVTIHKQVGENDRLFGTVTHMDIAEALGAAGVEVDRRRIVVAEPIKSLGEYTVTVKLHALVQVPVKVNVVAS
jgi:large subunit ribosomal protein L9